MLPVSEGFLAALASSQSVSCRADVTKGGVRLFTGLPVTGGNIRVDRSSITRRALDLTVAPRQRTGTYTDIPALPTDPSHPLAFYGQEISVYWSLHYVGGTVETIPVGVFRIDEPSGSLLGDGEVRVAGVSREAFVADARFVLARTLSGPSAQSLIAELIHEVLPQVEVVASASLDARVPPTTFEEDRWGAIATIAAGIGAVVHTDPRGRFIIADAPTVDTPPVWTVAAGRGGVLVTADTSSSRADVRNAVVLRGGSPSSDSPPVQAVEYDDDPTSPTRWGDPHAGAFGMAPEIVDVPTVTTYTQARAAAAAQLGRLTGAASSMDITTIPNAALEAGDVLDVVPDPTDPTGSVRRHVVDAFTLPLLPGGEFPVATRDVRSALTP